MNQNALRLIQNALNQRQEELNIEALTLAEATGNEFGVLVMGSARLTAKNCPKLTQHLVSMLHRLTHDGVVDTWASGGGPGIMEIVNAAAKDAGANSWGIRVGLLKEQAHTDGTIHTHRLDAGMFEARLLCMAAISDVVLFERGGIGTLFELAWFLQRAQLRLHEFEVQYPVYPRDWLGYELGPKLIAVGSLYDDLRSLLDKMAGFEVPTINAEDKDLLTVVATHDEAEELIRAHRVVWDLAREKRQKQLAESQRT